MMKLIVNNRADTLKTDIKYFFTILNCWITHALADVSHEFQIHVSVRLLTIKLSQWARMNFCSYRKNIDWQVINTWSSVGQYPYMAKSQLTHMYGSTFNGMSLDPHVCLTEMSTRWQSTRSSSVDQRSIEVINQNLTMDTLSTHVYSSNIVGNMHSSMLVLKII